MKRVIYKYRIGLERTVVKTSGNPIVRSVQYQRVKGEDVLTAWIEQDYLGSPDDSVTLLVVGTGHTLEQVSEMYVYVTTVQNAGYVWHVYEVM